MVTGQTPKIGESEMNPENHSLLEQKPMSRNILGKPVLGQEDLNCDTNAGGSAWTRLRVKNSGVGGTLL